MILDDIHEGNSSLKRTTLGRGKPRSLEKDLIVDLYGRFGGRRNLRSICMAIVMRELDSILSLDPGTHGLNEELGRHSDRDSRVECMLCGAECESVVHVLWECSSYRDNFQEVLKQLSFCFI